MDELYVKLLKDINSLDNQSPEVSGIDSFLETEKRIKMSSIDDFFGFLRIGEDLLIHKAKKDLWRIVESENGEVLIERMFEPSSNTPLRI